MSRKHCREVAQIIQDAYNEHFDSEQSPQYAQGWLCSYIASAMATMFELDNSNFDRGKFMEACFPKHKEL